MELRHLKYFLAVAEELHFNRAAQRLHMQQPPLSQQIRQLEEEIGVQLFERTTRSVKLTEAGVAFREHAYSIVRAVDEAGDIAVRASRGVTGRLRAGFTGSATYSLLPLVASAFRREFPSAVLEAQGEMLTPAQVDGLVASRLDVGFGRLMFAVPELNSRVVRNEVLSVVLPQGHRLAEQESIDLSDLAEDPFLALPGRWGSTIYELTIQACAEAGFSPRFVHELSQTSTLIAFVAAGFGVALVPDSSTHISVTGAVHRPLARPIVKSELVMTWRRNDDSPLLGRFLNLVERGL